MKRDVSLQPLSRQHHHGLLLCWKIRTGLKREIEPQRIKKYVDWFYKSYITPHFIVEEDHIFPILGNDHVLVVQALEEHKNLHALFQFSDAAKQNLIELERALEQHIRFEERVLFQKIQEIANKHQLKAIDEVHIDDNFTENISDEFWKK